MTTTSSLSSPGLTGGLAVVVSSLAWTLVLIRAPRALGELGAVRDWADVNDSPRRGVVRWRQHEDPVVIARPLRGTRAGGPTGHLTPGGESSHHGVGWDFGSTVLLTSRSRQGAGPKPSSATP